MAQTETEIYVRKEEQFKFYSHHKLQAENGNNPGTKLIADHLNKLRFNGIIYIDKQMYGLLLQNERNRLQIVNKALVSLQLPSYRNKIPG